MTSSTVLVAAEAFDEKLDAVGAARAIGQGLHTGNPELDADLCPIEGLPADLDARMKCARAVVIGAAALNHETLLARADLAEVATRARQSGVPCYAVTASAGLDLFEARILDLQLVLEARDERALISAAKKIAEVA